MAVAKVGKSGRASGAIDYLLRDDKTGGKSPAIIGGNVSSFGTKDEIKKDFVLYSKLKTNVKNEVVHISISLKPDEHLSRETKVEFSEKLLEKLNFKTGKIPYIIVEHHDKNYEHWHIVAGRITSDAETVKEWKIAERAIAATKELERQFGLCKTRYRKSEHRRTKRGEYNLIKRTKENSVLGEAKVIIDEVLEQNPTTRTFVERLEKKGFRVQPNISENSGKMRGFAYSKDEIIFRSSALGKAYSFQNLQKNGLDYKQERDASYLLRIKQNKPVEENKETQLATSEGDELFTKFKTIFKQAGTENILNAKDGVVKFETKGRQKSFYELELQSDSIRFAEQIPASKVAELLTDSHGLYFSRGTDGKFTYAGSFEREGYLNVTDPIDDERKANQAVEKWIDDGIGKKLVVTRAEFGEEFQAVGEELAETDKANLKKYLAEQTGRMILADAAVNQAAYELADFDKHSAALKYTVKTKNGEKSESQTVSLDDLRREKQAVVELQIEGDRKSGIVKIIAESERTSPAKVERKLRLKYSAEQEANQKEIVEAVERKIIEQRQSYQLQLSNAEVRRNSEKLETVFLAKQAAKENIADVKPLLPLETVWTEQTAAARRGDTATFVKLEEIHQAAEVPRPNDIYAELRGAEIMKSLHAAEEKKNFIENLLSPVEDKKHIIAELEKDADGELKIKNLKIGDAQIKYAELQSEAEQARAAARHEKATAEREAVRPIRHLIDPFSPISGKLAWFSSPKETLNAHVNPIEIVKNSTGMQIIRAVGNYLEHTDNAAKLNEVAAVADTQAAMLKARFSPVEWTKAEETAEAVKKAVENEERVREILRKDQTINREVLKTPARSFTDNELKDVGETAVRTGTVKTAGEYAEILQEDKEFAAEVGETAAKAAERVFLTELRAAATATEAIEAVRETATGTLEAYLDPVKFRQAAALSETAEVLAAETNRAALSEMSAESIEEAAISAKPLAQPELDKFLSEQLARTGAEVWNKTIQPLSAEEQTLAQKMLLPNEAFEKFEQIAQTDRAYEMLKQQAETATRMNVQYQDTGHNFTTVNPNTERENAAKEFWEKDRQMREMQIANQKVEALKNMTEEEIKIREARELAEIEAAEAAELAEEAGALKLVI